jgi:hypothetical protein
MEGPVWMEILLDQPRGGHAKLFCRGLKREAVREVCASVTECEDLAHDQFGSLR